MARKEKRKEEGMAKSYEDFKRIAKERGYNPYWAVLRAKQRGYRVFDRATKRTLHCRAKVAAFARRARTGSRVIRHPAGGTILDTPFSQDPKGFPFTGCWTVVTLK